MATLTKLMVQRGPHDYELALEWNDGALVEGSISFGVKATRRNRENPKEEPIEVSATVALVENKDGQPELVISFGNAGAIARFPLRDLVEESQIIDLIPAWIFGGDLIVGCMIRSGLSTTVAQVIECKNSTSGVPWFVERCRHLGGCLRDAIPDMSSKMFRRAIRCVLRVGF